MTEQLEKDLLHELCDKGYVYFIHDGHLVHVQISLENIYDYSSWLLSELNESTEPHDGGVCNGNPLDAIRMAIA